MDLVLVVRRGQFEGRVFEIAQGDRKTIGRADECEIRLPDQGVSRRHCTIENLGAVLRLVDLDSANGTYINERLVKHGSLAPGDELWVGPTVLECRARPAPVRSARTPGEATLSFSEDVPTTVVSKVVDTQFPGIEALADAQPESLDDLRRLQRNLATAYEVSKMMASAPSLEPLFKGVINSIFKAIEADRAALLLQDRQDKSDELEVKAARSRSGDLDEEDITVSRTVVQDVLKRRVSSLSRDASADDRYKKGQSIIRQKIRSVMCAPVFTDESVIGVLYADSRSLTGAFDESDLELLALIGNQAGVAIHRARLMEEQQKERQKFFFSFMRVMAKAVDKRDGYTHAHSVRVAEFAKKIAAELGAEKFPAGLREDDDALELIEFAGVVHDVGKIAVPDHVLGKEGKLEDEEFELIKEHPTHGEDILREAESDRVKAIMPGVRHHHEKWDGSGYPDGLAGEDIPFLGRLLAVADVLDALSSKRPYRDAWLFDDAVERIEQDAGSHFDPEVARAAVALHARGELDVPREPHEPESDPTPATPRKAR